MSGLGTVTHVVGDKLVAFGHPMIGGGIEALAHRARATCTGSSPPRTGPSRSASRFRAAGHAGQRPPGLHRGGHDAPRRPPSRCRSRSTARSPRRTPRPAGTSRCRMIPFFAPELRRRSSLGNALETTTAERNEHDLAEPRPRSRSRAMEASSFEDFNARATACADGSLGHQPNAPQRWCAHSERLVNNPWQVAELESPCTWTVDVTARARGDVASAAPTVLDPEVDAGGNPLASASPSLPYQGDPAASSVEIEVPIPREPRPARTLRIKLEPGYARRSHHVATPESFSDLVDVLPKLELPERDHHRELLEVPKRGHGRVRGSRRPRSAAGRRADTLRPSTSFRRPRVLQRPPSR